MALTPLPLILTVLTPAPATPPVEPAPVVQQRAVETVVRGARPDLWTKPLPCVRRGGRMTC